MSSILPAATVVPMRDGEQGLEVLLLRRSRAVSFAQGQWVFPGGRIDKPDYCGDTADIEAAARRGAVREAMEETQLSIAESDLVYYSHWTTPPGTRKRYATWFFVAAVKHSTDNICVDGGEILEHRWYRPAAALQDHQDKVIDMLPPTVVTLSELSASDSVESALEWCCHDRPVPTFQPCFTQTERGVAVLYPGDAGYATADPEVSGPRHRCERLDEVWRYRTTE